MFLAVSPAFSQMVMGGRAEGLSEATAALSSDEWALFANPADMPVQNTVSFFAMRHFGFASLTDYAFQISYNTHSVQVGLGGHTFGYKYFRQNDFRVGFCKRMMHIRFGAVLNYINYVIPEPYGSAGTFGINLGLETRLMNGLWLGTWVANINQPTIGKSKEELPQALSVGLEYRISTKALYLIECYKDIDFPVSIRSGLEFNPVKILDLRAGIETYPESFSLGIGINRKGISFDFAAVHHMVLGWSPAIDMNLRW